MRVKTTLFIGGLVLAAGVPASATAAITWTPYFSDDTSPHWDFCNAGEAVSGVRCLGSYCDKVSIRCEALPFGIEMSGHHWSGYFSEEVNGVARVVAGWFGFDFPHSHVCNWNRLTPGFMTAFSCKDSYCDEINLKCATPMMDVGGVSAPAVVDVKDCYWTDLYSEEEYEFSTFLSTDEFIAGVACFGSRCDDKQYFVCTVLPAANSCMDSCGGQARDNSCWCDSQCTFLGDCCGDFELACT